MEAWYGPSHHLQIDVKSSVDYGKTNSRRQGGIQAHFAHIEDDCRAQHGLSEVTPFAITAPGGMGDNAIKLLAELGVRGKSMIKVNDEMGLNWLVPAHGKYWHRRFRGIVIQGWYYTYTTCMGIEHVEDQFAEKGEATIENAMRLRGILEGEHQCPICGKEQDDCNCTCHPEYIIDGIMISCGQRCAVGRIWPPCVACKSCGTCCRCSDHSSDDDLSNLVSRSPSDDDVQQQQPFQTAAAPPEMVAAPSEMHTCINNVCTIDVAQQG